MRFDRHLSDLDRAVAVAVVIVACFFVIWWFVFSSGITAPPGFVYEQY